MKKYQVNIDKGFRGVPCFDPIEADDGDVECNHLAEIGFLIPLFDMKTDEESATSATGLGASLSDLLRGRKSNGGE